MLRLYFKIKFPLNLEGFKINHSLFPKLAASQSRYLNFVILPQFVGNSQGKGFDTPKKGDSGRGGGACACQVMLGSLSIVVLQLGDGGGVSPTQSAGGICLKTVPLLTALPVSAYTMQAAWGSHIVPISS